MHTANCSLTGKNCLIDLHQHLDGSISVENACILASMQGIDLPEKEELRKQLSVDPDCRDLNQYLEKFALPLSLLQTRAAIAQSVRLLLGDLKEQGIQYSEVRFAPQLHRDGGLTQEEVVLAALEGLGSSDIPGGLILCCMRGPDTHVANLETVALAAKYRDQGVLAVDIAGAEALFPTADYAPEFALARELGVPYTIHAGEADGPESIWCAIRFGTKRLGHGVRSLEDGALIRYLADNGITLECCPTSNLQTQIFQGIEEFPARRFLDAGVRFTINTDNTSVSGTNLRREWQRVIDAFSLTDGEVARILHYAADAAFAPEALREKLHRNISDAFGA